MKSGSWKQSQTRHRLAKPLKKTGKRPLKTFISEKRLVTSSRRKPLKISGKTSPKHLGENHVKYQGSVRNQPETSGGKPLKTLGRRSHETSGENHLKRGEDDLKYLGENHLTHQEKTT